MKVPPQWMLEEQSSWTTIPDRGMSHHMWAHRDWNADHKNTSWLSTCYIYHSVLHIHPPSCISPSTFQPKFLHRCLYLMHRPSQPIWPFYQNSNMIFRVTLRRNSYWQVSRSPWWSGNTRTKPASAEQLRNSPSIASEFVNGVNATAHWKENPKECLETIYAMHGQPLSVDLDQKVCIRVSGGREKRRQTGVDQFLSVCNNLPMSTSRHGTRRGGVFTR